MWNPQTMSEDEEQQCRDKAFYLLKKYTSYTYLAHAAKHYEVFLDGYGAQLSDLNRVQPKPDLQRWFDANVADGTYQKYYGWFLNGVAIIAEGLKLLRTTPYKAEAYKSLRSDRLMSNLTGRGADFLGIEHDPFFIALGIHSHSYNDDNNEFAAAPIERAMLSFYTGLRCFSKLEQILLDYSSTSYTYLLGNPEDSEYSPSAVFPPTLPPCPEPATDPAGQIWSDRVIPTTGIWEPWFCKEGFFSGFWDRLRDTNTAKLTGRVGCPNYFLAGTKAYNYGLENRSPLTERVAWRLLWQDDRYLNGTIPPEKTEYLRPLHIARPS